VTPTEDDAQTTDRTARPEDTPRQRRSLPAGAAWLQRLTASRERVVVLAVAAALVLFRSAVFVFFDAAFDSDQAIVGLMAKHLGEGRALPVFTYGQDYQLAIEAWLAAPLFWLFGPSVLALKLPLLVINVALAWLLILLLERDLGLRPALGLLVASLFIVTPPGTANYFLEASGGQVEPLFAVLLLWLTRHRPLTFGAILAFGFLQRVFTIYALGALVLIEVMDRSLFSAAGLQRKLKAGLAFTAVWQVVGLVRAQAGSAWGPATSGGYAGLPVPTSDDAALNVGFLLERFCFDAVSLPQSVAGFAGPFLSTMFGGHREPLVGLAIPSPGTQGVDGLWPLLGAALLLALGRIVWVAARGGIRPWHPGAQFATYLTLVGAQSSVVYVVSQCGQISAMTMRYTLLTVLGAVGIIAYHAIIEPRRPLRRLTLGVVAVWAVIGLWTHGRLLRDHLRDPPVNNRLVLADYLVANDIRYGYADFWDVYSTVFFADEQVILSSTSVWFIQEYEWLVQNHPDEAVWILREPCDGGTQVTDVHYVCPPHTGAN
jgi:hypothetical protein